MRLLVFFIILFSSVTAFAQHSPVLIQDVNQLSADFTANKYNTRDTYFEGNGFLYTVSDYGDAFHGPELWRTDGTAGGTSRITDLNPGIRGSVARLGVDLNGTFVFAGLDVNTYLGSSLWKTDGTTNGTQFIAHPIAEMGTSVDMRIMTKLNNKVVFVASSQGGIPHVGATDGTEAGTTPLTKLEFNTTANLLRLVDKRNVTTSQYLYFRVAFKQTTPNIAYFDQLWRTDGTESGTVMVATDVSGSTEEGAWNFAAIGNTVYFLKQGRELWKTDGTVIGTTLVRDLGTHDYVDVYSFNNKLIITGEDIWISDGTSGGTQILTTTGGQFYGTAILNGKFYASFYDYPHYYSTRRFFITDGTPGGTDFTTELGHMDATIDYDLPVVNNKIIVPFYTPETGMELGWSDGTAGPITLLKDINPGATGSSAFGFYSYNGKVYFIADDGIHGRELWITDGTTAGTKMIVDSQPGTKNSILMDYGVFNTTGGKMIFATDGSPADYDLFKITDNPSAITKYKDAPANDRWLPLGATGGKLFFYDAHKIWMTDGAGNDVMLKDFGSVNVFSYVPNAVQVGNKYLMPVRTWTAPFTELGTELFVTDGTPQGSKILKDINPGNASGIEDDPFMAKLSPSTVLFVANDGVHGTELWKTDGTTDGTVMVKDIVAGTGGAFIRSLFAYNGVVYFSAPNFQAGYSLWRSDGTQAGTYQLKDVNLIGFDAIARFAVMNNEVYFFAHESNPGWGLWKTDGTTNGTVKIKELSNGMTPVPSQLVLSSGKLYFSLWEQAHGMELWVSDGTANGTNVLDLTPGPESPGLGELTAVPGGVYFTSPVGTWRSAGTIATTEKVTDMIAWKISNVNDVLYFTASAPAYGAEYHRLVPEPFCIDPPTPQITFEFETPSKPVLKSTASNNNKWYFEGDRIDGETSQTLILQKAGLYTVSTSNNCATSTSDAYVVPKLDQTIQFSPGDHSYSEASFELSATVSSNLTPTFTADYDMLVINGALAQIQSVGKVTITAGHYGNALYNEVTKSVEICLTPPKLVIKQTDRGSDVLLESGFFVGNQWYHDGVAIPAADKQQFSARKTGTYTVNSVVDGCVGPMSEPVAIGKRSQQVHFSGATYEFAEGSFTLSHLTIVTSGLTPTYTANNNKVTISGNTVIIKEAGKVAITANQAGDDWWEKAPAAEAIFCINPSPPQITQNGVQLTSSASSGNQWYVDGVAINNATAQSYTLATSGAYTVRTSVDGCVSPASVAVVIAGAEDDIAGISFYPNPATDVLYIYSEKPAQFEIINSVGQSSGQTRFAGNIEVPVASYSKGVYFLKITAGKAVFARKFIKE